MKISCICGYVYEGDYLDSKPKQGDDPFREIKSDSRRGFFVDNPDRGGYYETDDYEVELYACPKCGTIRIPQHYSIVEKE